MSEKLDKVKRGLEACSIGTVCGPNCPYEDFRISDSEEEDNYNCVATLARDALEVLKEQEPKKVKCVRRLNKVMKGVCPACEMEIESVMNGRLTKFCKFCGQAVKWDAEPSD